MSKAEKLESMLEFLCNDVYDLISADLDMTNKYFQVNSLSQSMKDLFHFATIEQGTLLKDVINAAAMSDLFSVICSGILADSVVTDKELILTASLLQKSLHRYCWQEEYKAYLNARDAHDIQMLIGHWETDSAWLGGATSEGAIKNPFRRFVLIACCINGSPKLFQMYSKMLLLTSKLVLKSDGVTSEDQSEFSILRNMLSEIETAVIAECATLSVKYNQNIHEGSSNDLDRSNEINPANALQQGLDELNALIGLDSVKSEVTRLTNFLKIRQQRLEKGMPVASQTLHFVFTGNPGTGKTTVARIIAKILYGFQILKTPTFVEADRATLVGGYVGQTAIKTNEVIAEATDGVLFIDEAYSLAKSGGQDYGQEAIETLLKKMEDLRDRLVVIVAGYPNEMAEFISSNPGLESRFSRYINFDDYHVSDLCQIFELMCHSNSYQLTPEARGNLAIILNRVFADRDQNFGNARLVRNAYERTLGNHADRLATNDETITRESLSTIEAVDLPFKIANGIAEPFDLKDSRWHVNCPQCVNSTSASLPFLGEIVKCNGCGTRFRCPWWNLDRNTVSGLTGFEIFERASDLDGYEVQSTEA